MAERVDRRVLPPKQKPYSYRRPHQKSRPCCNGCKYPPSKPRRADSPKPANLVARRRSEGISQGLGKSVLLETCDQPGRNHGTQLTVRQNKGEFWCYGQIIQSKPFPKSFIEIRRLCPDSEACSEEIAGNVSRVLLTFSSTQPHTNFCNIKSQIQ